MRAQIEISLKEVTIYLKIKGQSNRLLHASQIYFGSKKLRSYSSRSPRCLALLYPIPPHVRVLTIKWQSSGRGDWTVLALDTALKVCSCWTGIMWYYRLCQQEETVSPFKEMGSTLYLIKEKKKFSTATVLYWRTALSWLISDMPLELFLWHKTSRQM